MILLFRLLFAALCNRFRSRASLEAEALLLRHQLGVLYRRKPKRVRLSGFDRATLVWLLRLWPELRKSVVIVQPETVVRCDLSSTPTVLDPASNSAFVGPCPLRRL